MTEQQRLPEGEAGVVGRRNFLTGLGYATGGLVVGMGLGVAIPALGDRDGDGSASLASRAPAPTPGTPGAVTTTPTQSGAPPQPVLQSAVDLPYLPQPEVPAPITRSTTQTVTIELETLDVEGKLADGAGYEFWTFNGTVPGPMIRVLQGDTVELTLSNRLGTHVPHNIDLHAVTGPGGGAALTNVAPGESKSFRFRALHPGVYIYHCATVPIDLHISNGMYGLIIVEPPGGLPPVDREFYICQGEIYTSLPASTPGMHGFDLERMAREDPAYVVFNGALGSVTGDRALTARVGEKVRIFFGVGGPNLTSSFHVIGEIFDRAATWGSFSSMAENVQTVSVAPGGATMVEFEVQVPGTYLLVDHALSRLSKGAAGHLVVEGPDAPEIYTAI